MVRNEKDYGILFTKEGINNDQKNNPVLLFCNTHISEIE